MFFLIWRLLFFFFYQYVFLLPVNFFPLTIIKIKKVMENFIQHYIFCVLWRSRLLLIHSWKQKPDIFGAVSTRCDRACRRSSADCWLLVADTVLILFLSEGWCGSECRPYLCPLFLSGSNEGSKVSPSSRTLWFSGCWEMMETTVDTCSELLGSIIPYWKFWIWSYVHSSIF